MVAEEIGLILKLTEQVIRVLRVVERIQHAPAPFFVQAHKFFGGCAVVIDEQVCLAGIGKVAFYGRDMIGQADRAFPLGIGLDRGIEEESARSDRGDAVWNGDGGQRLIAAEGVVADGGHARGDGQACGAAVIPGEDAAAAAVALPRKVRVGGIDDTGNPCSARGQGAGCNAVQRAVKAKVGIAAEGIAAPDGNVFREVHGFNRRRVIGV